MKTSDFDFALPPELIAAHPAQPRDSARLLHVSKQLADKHVYDLPSLLRPGDLLVFNDTRVIPARLTGKRGDASIEFTLHKRIDECVWKAFARPAKRLHVGDVVRFSENFSAVIEDKHEGEATLKFCMRGAELMQALHKFGHTPLPPYISRPNGEEASDECDYQTVFAKKDGAVAAPTAGLHFTPQLLQVLAERGVRTAPVTLHVGAGTFLPVKTEDTREHKMHSEYGEISAATARAVNDTHAAGGRVVAIGTTSLRIMESAASEDGKLREFSGDTDIFILPGYRFRVTDLLMTNFHLPRSTLFMLVCAFAGLEKMKTAYQHAMKQHYRFYSYGDASLLERA